MKQHNHYKLSQIQKAIIKITLWGLGLILFFFSTALNGTLDFNIISQIIGILSFTFGLFLSLIEKYLWKTRILKLPFLEHFWTPVLEGRWKGTLIRDELSHDFVLEIQQTFTSITCATYSKNSHSSAFASEILYNENQKSYQLIYYWNAKTANTQPNTGASNTFDGFTVLDIVLDGKQPRELRGSYFTDRQPNQTRGTIKLCFQQKTLKNSF